MPYLVTHTADTDITNLCNGLANDGLETYADTLEDTLLAALHASPKCPVLDIGARI